MDPDCTKLVLDYHAPVKVRRPLSDFGVTSCVLCLISFVVIAVGWMMSQMALAIWMPPLLMLALLLGIAGLFERGTRRITAVAGIVVSLALAWLSMLLAVQSRW